MIASILILWPTEQKVSTSLFFLSSIRIEKTEYCWSCDFYFFAKIRYNSLSFVFLILMLLEVFFSFGKIL